MIRLGILQLVILAGFSLRSSNAMAIAAEKIEPFAIMAQPEKHDWQQFMALSDQRREALWAYHSGRAKRLRDWNWAWRIGWVRVCATKTGAFCLKMIENGLADKALVVRAEAVQALGERFENSEDFRSTQLLKSVYANPRNRRGDKPLFVQFRVLFALRQIGGKKAWAIAAQLAGKDPILDNYWQRLAKI